jgi:hypothetical protein
MLAQNHDDLLFREPLSLHLSVLQSRPDSNSRWRKNSVAGHLAAIGVAVLPIFYPDAAGSPMIEPLFKLLAFVFSMGAGAVLFKALG